MQPVQHPIIRQTAVPETIVQLVILGAVIGTLLLFGVSFEISVLLLLIIGFGFNTLNVLASTTSQNVHLAEIRDQLIEMNRNLSRK